MDVVCSISSRPKSSYRIPGEREDQPVVIRDRKSSAGKSMLTAIEIVIDEWTRSPASMASSVKPGDMHRRLRTIAMAGIQTLGKRNLQVRDEDKS